MRGHYGMRGPTRSPRKIINGVPGRDSQFGCGVGVHHSQSLQPYLPVSTRRITQRFSPTKSLHSSNFAITRVLYNCNDSNVHEAAPLCDLLQSPSVYLDRAQNRFRNTPENTRSGTTLRPPSEPVCTPRPCPKPVPKHTRKHAKRHHFRIRF